MIPNPMILYEVAKIRQQELLEQANRYRQLQAGVNSAQPHKLLAWLKQQKMNLQGWYQQRVLKQVIRRAYRKFVGRHPRWAASLFDEYFLMGKAAPLLASVTQLGRLPDADELAAAWVAQIGSLALSPHSLKYSEAQQVAADFLTYLDAELQNRPRPSVSRPNPATY